MQRGRRVFMMLAGGVFIPRLCTGAEWAHDKPHSAVMKSSAHSCLADRQIQSRQTRSEIQTNRKSPEDQVKVQTHTH